MLRLILFAIVAILVSEKKQIYAEPTEAPETTDQDVPVIQRILTHPVCWTKWFDRDDPSGTGDWELLKDLRKENPGQICAYPLAMEVVTTGSPSIAAINTGQNFYINNPHKGFVCRNKDQKPGGCFDYKVRFACPCRS